MKRSNLRKQCVNILFQLGVFSDIQRKSHFRKTLIFSTLSKQRYIMEYHFAILIIWRSQVQALAGPHWKSSTYKDFVGAFSFVCEHLANTEHNLRHPTNTRKSCEHAFGVRKMLYLYLLRILFDFQSHSFLLYLSFLRAKPYFGVRKCVRKMYYSIIIRIRTCPILVILLVYNSNIL